MRKSTQVTLAAVSALLISAPAFAFHAGGVAQCEGCHTMHNSLNGAQMDTDLPQYQAGPYLLKANDQSSACLNCHQGNTDTGPSSYHSSTIDTAVDVTAGTAPLQRSPGGDFRWIKYGDSRGHNIVATDFAYAADARLTTSPGGSYPAASLTCSSCHDPHGKYRRFADGSIATTGLPIAASGSYNTSIDPVANSYAVGVYRFLGGIGYTPKSLGTNAFTNTVPAAVAPSTYNRTESASETRVAYGSSMSEWCANCHGSMHQDTYVSGQTGAGTIHPAGDGAKLTAAIAANYASYKTSGIVDAAQTAAQAYTSLVPFEIGSADYAVLKANATTTDANWTVAASTSNNVNCLSCHRVHASGFASMLRYGVVDFMTTADSGGAAVYSTTTTQNTMLQAAYYDRPATKYGAYQRAQCNKCHAKD